MSKNKFFDMKRFNRLVLNDLKINSKIILISIAAVFVFWTLLSFGDGGVLSRSLYTFVLYVGGFVITSRSFNDLHNSERAYHYLTLPCSNFERFLSKWIMTSIGYSFALLGLFSLYNLLKMGLHYALFSHHIPLINIFDPALWQSIETYIILHSIVFLGAVVFKRYSLIKTALSLGCLMLIFTVLTGSISFHFFSLWTPYAVQIQDFSAIVTLVLNILWLSIAPFCWLVTYNRIKEYEIC